VKICEESVKKVEGVLMIYVRVDVWGKFIEICEWCDDCKDILNYFNCINYKIINLPLYIKEEEINDN